MVADAINAADTAGFDFSQGDSDSDGWVDCLTIIHSGHGQEYGGNPATCIWSHQGSLGSTIGVLTKDGVKMYRYHTEPALRGWVGYPSTIGITRIGVVCHELGHFFGLPDLYDYSGTTDGLGDWCLMAGGSWNGWDGNYAYNGRRPAHFSAWCKVFLGFVKPTMVHSKSGLSLPRVEDNPVVMMLRDGTSNREYFLAENRAKVGFDNDSAIYPGLLVYHVDGKSANNDLNAWAHPAVKIEEADGDDSLGSMTASSESGDVWTSTSGLAGGFRDQTGNQSANAMMYQAAHDYNRTDNASYYSYNRLNNFSAAGSTMTCDATTLKTTVGSQTVASSGYTVSWGACSEASTYEIQEGVKATLTGFSDGAEDEDAMYENWYLGGTAKRTSAGYRSGSYSFALQYYDSVATKFGSSVQSLTTRKSFKVNSDTVISYYVRSRMTAGEAYVNFEISNDGGNTWHALETFNGYLGSGTAWDSRSYGYSAIHAVGINAGENCLLRFVADFEAMAGYWTSFPNYGLAVDDISITGIEMDGYSGWTTLDNNVTATSYGVTGRSHGIHAYRVRAYANGTWQGYGAEGETTVNNPPTAVNLTLEARKNGSATFRLSKYGRDPDGDALTVSFSGFSQGGQAAYANGTVTYTPASGFSGTESFTYTVTDSYGASVSATVTVTVSAPAGSGANILSVSFNSGTQTATVTFAGIPGATYALQYSQNLSTWTQVGGNETLPSGGVATVTHTSAPSSAFYRTVYVSGP
jgi:M6 family metalloprotease-like protein